MNTAPIFLFSFLLQNTENGSGTGSFLFRGQLKIDNWALFEQSFFFQIGKMKLHDHTRVSFNFSIFQFSFS
jgi:hypothetical protein